MLAFIGLLTLSFLAFYLVLILSLRIMDSLGFWARAGLGAVVPMLGAASLMGLLAGGAVFWTLS